MDSDHKEELLIWVGDLAITAKNIDELLEYVTKIQDFCEAVNFKLHPLKYQLFKNSISWCGRNICTDGVKYDPQHVSGLDNMAMPTLASKLFQFTSAMQWLRTSIPEFSVTIQPLLDALECAYTISEKRTKRSLHRATLHSIGWRQTKIDSFENCKLEIYNLIRFARRDHKNVFVSMLMRQILIGLELQHKFQFRIYTYNILKNCMSPYHFAPENSIKHNPVGRH